jgi:superfamily I DNA and RNA helicase
MSKKSILYLFESLKIGDDGEKEVLSAISKMLKSSKNSDNFLLIPKVKINDGTASREIDIVLLHPVLGLFIIEVKNWKDLDMLNADNNPFEQVNNYKNLMLTHLNASIGKVPINIEYRVVFPSVALAEVEKFFADNPSYMAYKKHTFAKESLSNKELFQSFFAATTSVTPDNKDFLSVAELLLDKKKLFKNGRQIVPVITQEEILFFDQKQLSILNGYTGDFKIIRGVAGTGKTVIMINYISNRLKNYGNEKFLVLCYNKKLQKNIRLSFVGTPNRQNCAVYSLFGFF